jgi:prepilin-type N-terminal cleavage/methylation domain-containing protein
MPSRMRNRRAFSLIETLVVLVITALIAKMSFPKIIAIREQNAVRAAKLQIASQITSARAAAIRRSQPSKFQYDALSQRWYATVGSNTVTGSVKLASLGVVVSSSDPSTSSIEFDSRGLATNLTARRVYRFTRNNVTDSMCVSRMGQISRYCQ